MGLESATGLTAKITTDSYHVTIIKDSVNIGTLPARSEITIADKFEIRIDNLIPDKSYITLNLNLKDSKTEKNYSIDICLHAPIN